jgi:CBS domain-containing protein
MSDGKSRAESNLAVRIRQTFWGDSRPEIVMGVRCPRRNLDVAVRECVRCSECSGVGVTPDDHEPYVVCDAPVEELHIGGSDDDEKAAGQPALESIMRTPVVCVGPRLSLDVLEALFLDSGATSAPVVDKTGRVTGRVSETDLVRYHQQRRTASKAPEEHVVADIMIQGTFALQEMESIPRAAALLAYESVDCAPVVNTAGQVVGLVSALDITRWVARRHGYVIGRSPQRDLLPSG